MKSARSTGGIMSGDAIVSFVLFVLLWKFRIQYGIIFDVFSWAIFEILLAGYFLYSAFFGLLGLRVGRNQESWNEYEDRENKAREEDAKREGHL